MIDLTYRAFLYLIILAEDLQIKNTNSFHLCSLPVIKKNVEQAQCDIATLHFLQVKKVANFQVKQCLQSLSREQP